MKKNNNIIGICIYVVLSLLLAITYMNLVKQFDFPKKVYIDISDSDYRSFINTVWQVQASVSLLSITLTSLIIGNLDKSIYGQKISDIILIRKTYEITYWDKVIISIVLSIVNFYFVAHGIIEGVTCIFIISIIFIASLIYDTFKIVFMLESYEKKVKDYIKYTLENESETEKIRLLKLLENEVIYSAVNKDNIYISNLVEYVIELQNIYFNYDINENIQLLHMNTIEQLIEYNKLDILKSIIANIEISESNKCIVEGLILSIKNSDIASSDNKNTDIRKKVDIFISLYELIIDIEQDNKNLEYIDDTTDRFLDNLIRNKDIVNIEYFIKQLLHSEYKYKESRLEYMIYDIANIYSNLTRVDECYKLNINSIMINLVIDKDYKYILKDRRVLPNFYNRAFYLLNNNNYLNKEDKIKVQSYFIDFLTSLYFEEENDRYWIIRESLFYIYKETLLSNNKDKYMIVNLISTKLYINNYRLGDYGYDNKSEKIYYIVAILNIYLYYVAFRDKECFSQELMDECKKILNFKANIDGTNDSYSLYDLSKICGRVSILKRFDNIKSELDGFKWEKIPQNGSKTGILSFVTNEYYVYFCLLFTNSINYKNLDIKKLEKDQIRTLLSYFDDNGYLKQEYVEEYKDFARWNNIQEEDIKYKNSDLYNTLIENFKYKALEDFKKIVNNLDYISKGEEKVKLDVKKSIEKNIFYKETSKYNTNLNIEVNSYISIDEFRYFDEEVYKNYSIIDNYDREILKIVDKKVGVYKYEYQNLDLSVVLSTIENQDLKIDSVINSFTSTKQYLLYNQTEENKDRLIKLEKSLTDLGKINRDRNTYYIDKSKFEVELSSVIVNAEYPETDWINKKIEDRYISSEDVYKVKIDGVLLDLNYDEVKFYFENNYRKISTKAYLYTNINEKCGYKLLHL